MSGILSQIVKAVAGTLLNCGAKSSSSSKKSSDNKSNDLISEVFNQFTGTGIDKSQGGRGKGQGGGGKGSGCQKN